MVAFAATNFSKRKSIVDTTGAFPQMLMELDSDAANAVKKSYVWANGQVLAQYDSPATAQRYFYLHDRLGSVRNVLHYDPSDSVNPVKVDHAYTYNPWGETVLEDSAAGAVSNDFRFAGYIWDDVVDQYFCNARWYDPRLTRFTGRDPVNGSYQEPLSLHKYLYCFNDPINYTDHDGKFALTIGLSGSGNINMNDITKYLDPGNSLFDHINPFINETLDQILGYTMIAVPFAVVGASGVGVTGGGAFVVAHDDYADGGLWDNWSYGVMGWLAGGYSLSTSKGIAVTLDIGYSPNAMKVDDLADKYVELGGSASVPAFGFNYTLGGSYGYSCGLNKYGEHVELWTVSPLGASTSIGAEAHAYAGYAWTQEWWNNR